MDFAIFLEIMAQLKGHRFTTLKELTTSTHSIIQQFDQDWYKNVLTKGVKRHRKCVKCGGKYFEKC